MTQPELPTLWRPGFLERAGGDRKGGAKWKWDQKKPIEAVVEAVRAAERGRTGGERVVVVQAKTASGKSTLIPPRIWKECAMVQPGGPGVVCTQPRRLTAIRIAQDVAGYKTNGVELGVSLGWLTGVSAKIPTQKTSLLYATMGSVFSALEGAESFAEFAQRWRYIIVDEAHERSVQVDLFIMRIKQQLALYAQEQWCPVLIIMSATINPDQYARYLAAPDACIVAVAGRAHPIAEHWPAEDYVAEDYVAAAIAKALEVHRLLPPTASGTVGDVLVFLPGAKEHKTAKAALETAALELVAAGQPTFATLSVLGATVAEEGEDYKAVFVALPTLPALRAGEHEAAPVRRIILATSVAETGLTVDTLAAVIDCGWSRQVIYLPNEDARGLITVPASRRAIEQRMGRAGRVAPGEFFPLYGAAAMRAIPEQPQPEVLTAAPAGVLARVLRLQPEWDPAELDLLEPLPAELIQAGLDTLFATGLAAPTDRPEAMDQGPEPARWSLTPVGRVLAPSVSTDPLGFTAECAAALLGAHLWGAAPRDVLAAVAMAAAGVQPYASPPRLWREVLPSTLGTSTGSPEALSATLRVAIADENAEAALLWGHFASLLAGYSAGQSRQPEVREAGDTPAQLAEQWAQRAGFNPQLLFTAAGLFARYADAALQVGLAIETGAPTLRELAQDSPRAFTAGLLRFKRALEHGYSLNVAERSGAGYRTVRGVHVAAPRLPPLKRLPRFLLYLRAEIAADASGGHSIALRGVSVLDGFTRGGAGAGGYGSEPPASAPAPASALAPRAIRDYWSLRAAARELAGDPPIPLWNHFDATLFDPTLHPTAERSWYAREGDVALVRDGVVGGDKKTL